MVKKKRVFRQTKVDMACPFCGKQASLASSPFNPRAKLKANDAVMCIECGRFALAHEYKEGLGLRMMNHEETVELSQNEDAYMMWCKWKELKHLKEFNGGTIH